MTPHTWALKDPPGFAVRRPSGSDVVAVKATFMEGRRIFVNFHADTWRIGRLYNIFARVLHIKTGGSWELTNPQLWELGRSDQVFRAKLDGLVRRSIDTVLEKHMVDLNRMATLEERLEASMQVSTSPIFSLHITAT